MNLQGKAILSLKKIPGKRYIKYFLNYFSKKRRIFKRLWSIIKNSVIKQYLVYSIEYIV
jgi:hypothetical protein